MSFAARAESPTLPVTLALAERSSGVMFSVRDMREGELIIAEAIIDGRTKAPKTLASAAKMFVPPDLALELRHYLETVGDSAGAWTLCTRGLGFWAGFGWATGWMATASH